MVVPPVSFISPPLKMLPCMLKNERDLHRKVKEQNLT